MKKVILAFLLILLAASQLSAAPITLIREYNYQAGDADSKLSSRAVALEQVKRLLLEEMGTYLISNTIVKDAQLTKDEIVTYTAGVVVTVILEEKWDGKTYYLKSRLIADPDNVARSLAAIKNDQERASELEQLRRKSTDSLKEIERLNRELAEAKKAAGAGKTSERTIELHKKFDEKASEFAALEYLNQGITLSFQQKLEEAAEAYSKAIELSPNWARAYALRGTIYVMLNENAKAARDLEHAMKLDPMQMLALSAHGVNLMKMGKKQEGLKEIQEAVEAAPNHGGINGNMGWALMQMNKPREALPYLNKYIKITKGKLPRAFFLRSRAYKMLGEQEKAKADMETWNRLKGS